jgi:MerR family transcriptional regulator, thiopeptide resistance regulator
MGRYYRVGEVATLTRVSVRTLHHYDRIGLLRPALHSSGGYRLYGESELFRLQQILTLRYLGFPLQQIGELLDRADFDLVASLRVQRQVLHDRIAELERISSANSDLVDQRLATGEWSWQLVIAASQAVGAGLTRGEDTMDAYYTPEQMKQFEAAGKATPQEEIGAIEEAWTTLLAEVRAARAADLDPASAEAGSLADRWVELSRRTMQHFPTACGRPSKPITNGAPSRDTIERRKRKTSRISHALRPPAKMPARTPVQRASGMLCGKRNRLSGSQVRLASMSRSRF